MKFYKAWNYLNNHVIFKDQYGWSQFQRCLEIEVVKVNPKTNAIDDNTELNTSTRVWLEAGPYVENTPTHDISLDCGAKTFEKAIIKLAKLVKKRYGDNPEKAIKKVNKHFKAYKEEIETLNKKKEKEECHQITLDEYSKQLEEKPLKKECEESNIVTKESENTSKEEAAIEEEAPVAEETAAVEETTETVVKETTEVVETSASTTEKSETKEILSEE